MSAVLTRLAALSAQARAYEGIAMLADLGEPIARLDGAIKKLSAPARISHLGPKDFDTTQRVISQALLFIGFFKDVAAKRVMPTAQDRETTLRLASEFCQAIEDGLAVETGVSPS